jgi:tetratricopeptide (TPR) repeat protein
MLAAAVLVCAVLASPVERGREFLARGDTAAALYWFEEAVRKTPSDAVAWRYAGFTYERFGRSQEAIRALERSVALSPDADTWSALSRVYMATGSWDKAAAAEERAVWMSIPPARRQLEWYNRVAATSTETALNVSETATRSSQGLAANVTDGAKATARGFRRAFWK